MKYQKGIFASDGGLEIDKRLERQYRATTQSTWESSWSYPVYLNASTKHTWAHPDPLIDDSGRTHFRNGRRRSSSEWQARVRYPAIISLD